ncbi:hypothetical protein FQK07_14335 [Synechococcus sp. BSF8S]|uniref:hypothetical protein n=1 Tax=Synechococcales TaxID=1890424 RepID=UPI001624C259|nr:MULTISPECIES: hypothetical protein [unclassified Synechococcus]MBC1262406.1 hypothetical protein [Synechococcus sp. BSF8S]MBC1265308.1 hypothetical protein [Synechococcus sp. BSA11S]
MNATTSFDARQAQRVERFLQLVNWAGHRLGTDGPPLVDMSVLRSLPQGTLGHAWVHHLDDTGLEPFGSGSRRLQLHDGLHVLTGYGTDPIGEAEVQAFLMGAKLRPVHGLLLLGLLRMIIRQRRCKRILLNRAEIRLRLLNAYSRGRNSDFDPDTWQPEKQWQDSLTDVQAALGIHRVVEEVAYHSLTP